MSDYDPNEIAAYEVVRQRLIRLAQQHPWLLEVSIALKGRACLTCAKRQVVEQPPGQFRCLACSDAWTEADLARKYRPSAHRVTG